MESSGCWLEESPESYMAYLEVVDRKDFELHAPLSNILLVMDGGGGSEEGSPWRVTTKFLIGRVVITLTMSDLNNFEVGHLCIVEHLSKNYLPRAKLASRLANLASKCTTDL